MPDDAVSFKAAIPKVVQEYYARREATLKDKDQLADFRYIRNQPEREFVAWLNKNPEQKKLFFEHMEKPIARLTQKEKEDHLYIIAQFPLRFIDTDKAFQALPKGLKKPEVLAWQQAFVKADKECAVLQKKLDEQNKPIEALVTKNAQTLAEYFASSRVSPEKSGKKAPLASHVRVLSSTGQEELAAAGSRTEPSLFSTELASSIALSSSLDQTVDTLSKKVFVVKGEIQAPQASKRDDKKAATIFSKDKAVNENPNNHRIAFFVRTEGYSQYDADRIKLDSQHVEKALTHPKTGYRFDKIVYIDPLTEGEKKAGVNMRDKLNDSFKKETTAFKAKHEGKDQKLGCVLMWDGHGGAHEIDPKKPLTSNDLRYYQQGTKNFEIELNAKEYISDSDRKRIHEWLNGFEVFEFLAPCHSGAGISRATPTLPKHGTFGVQVPLGVA